MSKAQGNWDDDGDTQERPQSSGSIWNVLEKWWASALVRNLIWLWSLQQHSIRGYGMCDRIAYVILCVMWYVWGGRGCVVVCLWWWFVILWCVCVCVYKYSDNLCQRQKENTPLLSEGKIKRRIQQKINNDQQCSNKLDGPKLEAGTEQKDRGSPKQTIEPSPEENTTRSTFGKKKKQFLYKV